MAVQLQPAPPIRNRLMDLNRRDFIVVPAATIATSLFAAEPAVPWQRRIRRVGQTNMTEHDPVVLDVEQWADYWVQLQPAPLIRNRLMDLNRRDFIVVPAATIATSLFAAEPAVNKE